jgi:hypothetical protein
LEQYCKSNQALKMMIGELDLKYDGLRGELRNQLDRVKVNRSVQNRVQRDMLELAAAKNDKVALKNRFLTPFNRDICTGGMIKL